MSPLSERHVAACAALLLSGVLGLVGCVAVPKAPRGDTAFDPAPTTPAPAPAAAPAPAPVLADRPAPSALVAPKAVAVKESPRAIVRPAPAYPSGVQGNGEVLVRVQVDARGRVGEVQVVQSTHPRFAEAASRAVKGWRFSPARDALGIAMDAQVQLRFRFHMDEESAPDQVGAAH